MKKIISENAVGIVLIITLSIALIVVLAIGMKKFQSQEEPKDETIETIVNSYVNNRGHKVFVISDGTIAEIVANKPRYRDYIQLYDREYNRKSSIIAFHFTLKIA